MKIFGWIYDLISGKDDPVRQCIVYKSIGCIHVDGFLCDMNTCGMLSNLKEIENG